MKSVYDFLSHREEGLLPLTGCFFSIKDIEIGVATLQLFEFIPVLHNWFTVTGNVIFLWSQCSFSDFSLVTLIWIYAFSKKFYFCIFSRAIRAANLTYNLIITIVTIVTIYHRILSSSLAFSWLPIHTTITSNKSSNHDASKCDGLPVIGFSQQMWSLMTCATQSQNSILVDVFSGHFWYKLLF